MDEPQFVTVHGHRRAYVKRGNGPALLLLHGLACDHTTWAPVVDRLAERFTVIAPDFLGHGRSDKPRADYTVAGYANGMRDLLTVLGIDKVTVVGHSFGGGVAMQFAYQFPERTERLMLLNAGGLGREVTPLIRAISLPGWIFAFGVLTMPGLRQAEQLALRRLRDLGLRETRDLAEVADILESFADPRARRAIVHLVRAAIDWRGQVLSMRDRAYLTAEMPVHVVWGRDDMVIPVKHAEELATLAPTAEVTIFDDSGHFPHKDDPERFADLLVDWVDRTSPATYSRAKWRRLLRSGALPPVEAVATA
ncbi:pimeloyl-ACP methyl ester carboxylesterase [Nocardioides thalensis]|uniref:Pimeloyl-ACP methyl ester carboxylesterase n=1 Tax=Nocardioides thalensis TaxID=1914755 RepID=A0A853BYE3_9ACTN|nr:alpha/beta fold hydrolase [Nocardioides thalensis]NYJ00970.1 pimeloyl-ACP methyl ester carboxylesterase [Nocardioides thalensis]